MSEIVIIAGSENDLPHVKKITQPLETLKRHYETHYISAHKNTKELLTLLKQYEDKEVVFITVAGRSNALSGVVACNTKHVVIACPPYTSLEEYMVDIHSSLRMPSYCPVLTILDPTNCALAVERILRLGKK